MNGINEQELDIKGFQHSRLPPWMFNSQKLLSSLQNLTYKTATAAKTLSKEKKGLVGCYASTLLSTSVLEEPLERVLFGCQQDNRAGHSCLVGDNQLNGEETDTQRRKKFVFLTLHLAWGYVLSCCLN